MRLVLLPVGPSRLGAVEAEARRGLAPSRVHSVGLAMVSAMSRYGSRGRRLPRQPLHACGARRTPCSCRLPASVSLTQSSSRASPLAPRPSLLIPRAPALRMNTGGSREASRRRLQRSIDGRRRRAPDRHLPAAPPPPSRSTTSSSLVIRTSRSRSTAALSTSTSRRAEDAQRTAKTR